MLVNISARNKPGVLPICEALQQSCTRYTTDMQSGDEEAHRAALSSRGSMSPVPAESSLQHAACELVHPR